MGGLATGRGRGATPLRDGVRRYVEWETGRGTPAAPVARRGRARPLLVGPRVRTAAVVVAAMLVGAAGASLIVSVGEAVEAVVHHHAMLLLVAVIVSVVAYAARPATLSG